MGAVKQQPYVFGDIHDRIKALFEKHHTQVIDFAPIFGAMTSVDLLVHPYDRHPNEIAHKVIADTLADTLQW
jgi:hypothetical protein